ncbi:MAG: aspartate aminotransferase family protein [Solirubrobacteraceae bacterium]|nr:aspartate aminotransferase family protein [Solirubrobacteraceae bacterium]
MSAALAGAPGASLSHATALIAGAVERAAARRSGPWSGISPDELRAQITALHPCPDEGRGLAATVSEIERLILDHGVWPADPACAAHLHCAPLVAAAATELAIGATNQSMDSFDQAPAATFVEDHLVGWLAGLLGLPAEASGVMTSGGTASNLLGLLLAREHTASTVRDGLPAEAADWRIVTSESAHFSVRRSAMLLGLGERAVVAVDADASGAMDIPALRATLDELRVTGLRAIAIVATAGTTDHGAIDPLAEVAELAASAGAWLHVDAAVGGALALSHELRSRITGIERADSVTVDLHKLWWQPIGASALLVRDAAALGAIRHHSDYLNREEDEELGVVNLATRSLDTSRRFDALKVLVALRATGRRELASMVERCVALADAAAAEIEAHPRLELVTAPSTITVLFRHVAGGEDEIQRTLLASGEAVIGRTRIEGRSTLKLTLMNPAVEERQLHALLDTIADAGGPA